MTGKIRTSDLDVHELDHHGRSETSFTALRAYVEAEGDFRAVAGRALRPSGRTVIELASSLLTVGCVTVPTRSPSARRPV